MKFKEVYFDGDIVELDKKDIDRKKNLKILNILYYYGIEFKLDTAGSIYIPQSIYDDRDFRLSVTSKSEDINWINDHVIKDLSDTVSR